VAESCFYSLVAALFTMEELTSFSVTGRAMAGEPTRPALNTAKVEAIIG